MTTSLFLGRRTLKSTPNSGMLRRQDLPLIALSNQATTATDFLLDPVEQGGETGGAGFGVGADTPLSRPHDQEVGAGEWTLNSSFGGGSSMDSVFAELVVWRVPKPVPPSSHAFKYRLVYIADGERVIGFDNERGKGDHWHEDGREHAYIFRDIDTLLDDFVDAVERWRAQHDQS